MIQVSWPFVIDIYITSIFALLAFFWAGFVFFKRAQDEHVEEKLILDIIVIALFFGLLAGRLGLMIASPGVFLVSPIKLLLFRDYPGIHMMAGFVGVLVAVWTVLGKKKDKVFDYTDMLMPAVISGWSWFLILESVISRSLTEIIVGIALFGMFVWLWRLEGEYRTFDWYRMNKNQAKTGLITGLSLIALGSMSWIIDHTVLSNKIGYTVLIILGVLLIYTRSGRDLRDDVKNITKHGKK